MVAIRWSELAARAVFYLSTNPTSHADRVLQAAKALQGWYHGPSGLWTTTGWWNSANCLTVLADWALHVGSNTGDVNVPQIIATTFENAQKTHFTAQKILYGDGLMQSTYTYDPVAKRGFSEFLNEFYDDEGWWALALIRSWDVTKENAYLDMAVRIFADMQNGTDTVCGGGIWWSKEKKYKNAISNELYLSVAASLANRIPNNKDHFLKIAKDQWTWFKNSGMINGNSLINDGLRIQEDGKCVNNGLPTWSYNQGVILGGLVELFHATADTSYLADAVAIATAAITKLSDNTGIIHEVDRCEPNCGNDGPQFKGIFMRNLQYLTRVVPNPVFQGVIRRNAHSIWTNDRNEQNQLGIKWTGPPDLGKGPTAATHSSAMDVLVGALAISGL